MDVLKKYDLHKNDHSKLHFGIYDARTYFLEHFEKSTAPHRHSYFQLIWFKNPGKHYVDYEPISHVANSFFFIATEQVHHFCPEEDNSGVLFHFNDFFIHKNDALNEIETLDTLFPGFQPHVLTPDANSIRRIAFLTDALIEEHQDHHVHYREMIYHLFQSLLLTLRRSVNNTITIPAVLQKEGEKAHRFKQIIQNTVHGFHSVKWYAEKLHITPKKLTEIVKDQFGYTPMEIIHKARTEEARRLLGNTSYSIKEVAFELGFDQATYFTKYFRKFTGMTPKDFRKRVR